MRQSQTPASAYSQYGGADQPCLLSLQSGQFSRQHGSLSVLLAVDGTLQLAHQLRVTCDYEALAPPRINTLLVISGRRLKPMSITNLRRMGNIRRHQFTGYFRIFKEQESHWGTTQKTTTSFILSRDSYSVTIISEPNNQNKFCFPP